MFYRQSPVVSIILVIVFLASYIYYKSRNGRNSSNPRTFFSGRQSQNNGRVDDLVTLVVLQQMVNKPTNSYTKPVEDTLATEREKAIEQTRKEVHQLLEE